ncbi:MAG: tetratricopeptide repeat protein [Bryobacteraceae bacterium]|jgi:tetratricopeptide (TPR) repeat protein
MKFSFAHAAGLACLLAVRMAAAQTSYDNFDDLARRAQAALDSDPAQAAVLYKQALEFQPTWPEGWFYLGGALYRLDRYAEGIDAFHKGLDLSPHNGPAWALMGMCEYELGHLDQTLADIGKGEDLGLGTNTAFEAAVRQRAALALIRQSFFDRAMAQLQPLIKNKENTAPVMEAAGLCSLGVAEDPTKLPENKRKIVDMTGSAMWAAVSHRPQDAEQEFHRLLAAYPNEPGVHYAFGLYLMDTDQHGALVEFRKELSLNPTHWPTLLASAFLETRDGTPEAALQLAERARKVAPTSYLWLCEAEMGRALLAKDEPEKAVPLFEDSVKQQPDNAQTHFYLEQAYRRAGRKSDAQREKAVFVRLKSQQDPGAMPGLMNSANR